MILLLCIIHCTVILQKDENIGIFSRYDRGTTFILKQGVGSLRKYLKRFILLLAYLFLLASCANELENTEVHVPEVKINGTSIDFETQTICWGSEECLDTIGESGYELTIDKLATTHHHAEIGDNLAITFHETPKPNTINLSIDEIPEYHDQWSYNGETIKAGLPNEPGTYTYSMLVYWHGEKASTAGLANYQFQITVE